VLAFGTAQAKDYRVDPSTFGQLPTGSLVAGDRVLLAPGKYGHLMIRGIHAKGGQVEIVEESDGVHATFLDVRNSSNVVIRGIDVWPEAVGTDWLARVQTKGKTANIVLDQLDIRGGPNDDCMSWSLADWKATDGRAVLLYGSGHTIQNSRVRCFRTGIFVLGDNISALNNDVRGMTGDFFAFSGNNVRIENNRIADGFDRRDGNHRDAIQSRRPRDRAKIADTVIAGNVFHYWTGPADHPLRSPDSQGFMLHDNPMVDLTVRDNEMVISAWHGIFVKNGGNALITGNTIVSASPGKVGWINTFYGNGGSAEVSRATVAGNRAERFKIDRRDRETNNALIRNEESVMQTVLAKLASPPPAPPAPRARP